MSSQSVATRDKHRLYELAVQNPGAEVDFIDRVFRDTYGRTPHSLREDFCGTANLAGLWVAEREDNTALGVDLDGPTLDWGRTHNLAPLGDAADRVTLLQRDVRDVSSPRVDVLAAFNFSWWTFREREQLLGYLRNCRDSLNEEGLLVMDIYGGPEAQVLQLEETEHDGFTYVWDQDAFNPITHEYRCRIHFRFPDGTEMTDAFVYDWRLWTLPEATALLNEAGFGRIDVYWEGADEDGEPDGVFRKSTVGDDAPAWVAYIVARRDRD